MKKNYETYYKMLFSLIFTAGVCSLKIIFQLL